MGQKIESERKSLIHMIRSGKTPAEAAQEVGRCRSWGYKWWGRYCKDGWAGLQEQSRAPKQQPTRLAESVRQAIRRIRSALEAEAHLPDKLSYIGAPSIRSHLKEEGIQPLPGQSVWATLHVRLSGAKLCIYDTAPDTLAGITCGRASEVSPANTPTKIKNITIT